jgi:hypothetical protein
MLWQSEEYVCIREINGFSLNFKQYVLVIDVVVG